MQPNSGAQVNMRVPAWRLRSLSRAKGKGNRHLPDPIVGPRQPIPAAQYGLAGSFVIKTAPNGDIDLANFRAKAGNASENLAGCNDQPIPRHGVFEENVTEADQNTTIRRSGLDRRGEL